MQPLTQRQHKALEAIVRFVQAEDRPPTMRELAARLRRHVKTVYQYILALEAKGCITRRKGRIHLAPELRRGRGIPIVGRVAAGVPILAVENREGTLSLDELFGSDDVFAVRVTGDSMQDAGIRDGDLAIVRRSDTVPSGAVAVCYVGDDQDVTIKRLRMRRDGIELVPANEAYPPVRVARDDPDFRVGGTVIGVVRRVG